MTDDEFILEEEGTGSSRRPFLIAVATLTTIFILASVCSLLFLFSNRSASNPEATAIAATNAVILITNEAVTAAIDATNIALSQPTETPEPTLVPTATSTPVADTATPTETSVVEQQPKDTVTPNLSGTSAVEQVDEDGSDAEGTAGGDNGTATPIPAATSSTADDADALPQTGFETWGTLAVGLMLAAVLIAARRLRRNE